MHNIVYYGTKNRDSLKMSHIYSTLTWVAEWRDFIADGHAQHFWVGRDSICTPKTIKLGDSK
jgi:hypothetical protein